MRYDLDIHALIPQEIFADPKLAGFLNEVGFAAEARGTVKALLRDPEAAQALHGASDDVKALCEAAGFGFVASGRTLPPGHYLPEDEARLADTLDRLAQLLPQYDLSDADWNGFDLTAMLNTLAEATPFEPARDGNSPPEPDERRTEPPPFSAVGPDPAELVKPRLAGREWAAFAVCAAALVGVFVYTLLPSGPSAGIAPLADRMVAVQTENRF